MNNQEIRQQLLKARDEYINLIKAELMGPGSEFSVPEHDRELISSSPLSRYSVGILFPQGYKINQENDETVSLDEEPPEEFINDSSEEDTVSEKRRPKDLQTDDTASENLDEEICMANQYNPSSMGLTFLVKGDVDRIHCKISFATYRSALLNDCIVPYVPENIESYTVPAELEHIIAYDKEIKAFHLLQGTTSKEISDIFERDTINEADAQTLKNILYKLNYCFQHGYVRIPHTFDDVEISFDRSDYTENKEFALTHKLNVKLTALRTHIKENIYSLTIMLVNDNRLSVDNAGLNSKVGQCIFQSKIEISTDNNNCIFTESNDNLNNEYIDDEERSLDLLYRNKKIFASGLGTSADWNVLKDGSGKIWTDYFPVREIPSMSFSLPKNDLLSDDELSMKYLSDLNNIDRETKLSSMSKLVDLYSSWINNLEITAASLDSQYKTSAFNNISECKRAAERMYSGIETLRNNDNAYNAFALANRAMFMQRVHLQKQSEMYKENSDRYPDDPDISYWLSELNYYDADDTDCRWRPFQIAFLLMDIDSIVCDDSPDRRIVDLIWFPTGGGKTEAYLGLTAFTIFYRKLSYPDKADGTTVIMRYTLRLLAAQQFTRAATLICACDYIRRDCQRGRKYPYYPLGKDPITIGLWIGNSHIPNKNEGSDNSAAEHLKQLQNVSNANYVRTAKDKHNKFQVLKCPWCGTKLVKDSKNNKLIGKWGYSMRDNKHFYMFCPHEDCHFTDCLPIQIIDDELYSSPPTLLFGTVDKFAMMPWDGRIGSFFGVNSQNRAPELIIQDELHLISGSLGTMVGLYETAIDGLISMKGVKPKLIASTATIRHAKEQCSSLYNRDVVQFPAPGLDAEDSFFAKEDTIDYSIGKYGRTYVGIMPSGRTKAMTEIRAIASLLERIHLMDLPDEIKDKLWTLTVYFNSLKDLGKASTFVDDDVKDFILRLANRLLTSKRRRISGADELTSRISTTELNETLDKLEKIEYSQDNISAKRYASNILLATNMISVGIDVARLNTMLIVGQPKLTSEYIQASSRVGRSFPGVAFVQYDGTKSRDRSHYERFRAYHDSFYRFVEPTGVTPFSKPARERALHAVVATLLRHKEYLIKDIDADNFDINEFSDSISEIKKYVIDRINGINARSGSKLKDDNADIEEEIQEFFEHWQSALEKSHNEYKTQLYFGQRYMTNRPNDAKSLFKQFNSKCNDTDAIETLTSMRNVDVSVNGNVIIWED